MQADDATLAYILDTQIAVFEDARHDLQLSVAEIARRAKLPIGTVNAWAQGRNALSLWGLKKLLRVRDLAPLLSRLFRPEEYALVAVMSGVDLDGLAEAFAEFLAAKNAAHHPDSPAGRDLADCERDMLNGKVAYLPLAGKVAA